LTSNSSAKKRSNNDLIKENNYKMGFSGKNWFICIAIPDIVVMGFGIKPVISPTYSNIRRTCDICNDQQISKG
jgi:hypothetical protein